jgi:D-amino-acid oxidase
MLQSSLALGGLGLVGGCATTASPLAEPQTAGIVIPPIRASMSRVIDVTVCLRPFRAAGPRLDAEQVGDKLVVHNYGHGGSGWSLSWGSGTLAVRKAMANNPREVAVIGCGALGLTAAILAQTAGAKVTIYARDFIADTRSARATGTWSPDSRIALDDAVDPGFPALWEQMARSSFKTFRSYLGLPGEPVEWVDRYVVRSDGTPQRPEPSIATKPLSFAHYGERIADITPGRELLPAGATSFPPEARVSRQPTLIFNIAGYSHALMAQFLGAGGKLQRTEFHTPGDVARLKEPVVINCPGYGARALWRDESIVPVRGQMAWLVPQPEVRYALFYNGVGVVARRDGIGLQDVAGGDMRGYGDDNEAPDRAETEGAVAAIAELFGRMPA